MKQTAVEWLVEKLSYETSDGTIISHHFIINKLFEQAKEMEKEQIKDAFVECWKSNVPDGIECKLDAEQYYNETFKQQSVTNDTL